MKKLEDLDNETLLEYYDCRVGRIKELQNEMLWNKEEKENCETICNLLERELIPIKKELLRRLSLIPELERQIELLDESNQGSMQDD